ncbi:hypothetical protein D3C84_1210260 [compost metagenome]
MGAVIVPTIVNAPVLFKANMLVVIGAEEVVISEFARILKESSESLPSIVTTTCAFVIPFIHVPVALPGTSAVISVFPVP